MNTKEMRTLVRTMQSLLKSYDEHDSNLLLARNVRDYDNAKEAMQEDVKEMLSTMDMMVSQLNILMTYADALDIHDCYRLKKEILF